MRERLKRAVLKTARSKGLVGPNPTPSAMIKTWKDYFEKTKNNPPRELLIRALPYVLKKENALDLGAGALNETRHLLSIGFEHVTAIDKLPIAEETAQTLPKEHFSYVISKAEAYAFPLEKFDLVNAQYSLPFISPAYFSPVMQKIKKTLRPSGVFTGQLYGNRDEWNTPGVMSGMIFHTKEEAKNILGSFETLLFEEEDINRPTADGIMKHWHTFNFIVKK